MDTGAVVVGEDNICDSVDGGKIVMIGQQEGLDDCEELCDAFEGEDGQDSGKTKDSQVSGKTKPEETRSENSDEGSSNGGGVSGGELSSDLSLGRQSEVEVDTKLSDGSKPEHIV